MRATWQQVGEENFCSVLVSLIPTISGPEGEPVQKTKPTQHGVKELRYRRAAPHRPFRPLRSVSRNVSNSTRHKKKTKFLNHGHASSKFTFSCRDLWNILQLAVRGDHREAASRGHATHFLSRAGTVVRRKYLAG